MQKLKDDLEVQARVCLRGKSDSDTGLGAVAQYGSRKAYVALKRLNCGRPKSRQTVSIKYTVNLEDLMQIKTKNVSVMFYIITCCSGTLDIVG